MAVHHEEASMSARHTDSESRNDSAMDTPSEEQPLLEESPKVAWRPPPGFLWIQLGTHIHSIGKAKD